MAWTRLTLDDNPDSVTARILDRLKVVISGFVPTEGDPIVVLAEEVGRETAATNARVLTASEQAVADFGTSAHRVPAIEAETATTSVELTLTEPTATVPAGFRVLGTTTSGVEVAFTLLSDAVGVAGVATVTMVAETSGASANDVPAGTLTIITATATVSAAEALAASSGGVDAETQTAYLDRLVDYLAILRPSVTLAADAAVLARQVPGVHRALGVDNVNAIRVVTDGVTTNASATVDSASGDFISADVGRTVTGTGIPGGTTVLAVVDENTITLSANATATATGVTLTFGELTGQAKTVAVFPIDINGDPVSPSVKAEVLALLQSARETNFVVTVGDPTYAAVNVVFAGISQTGADPATVTADVNAAIRDFIDPARFASGTDSDLPTWEPITSVSYLGLVRAVGEVEGLADITTLTINGVAGDLALTGRAPLPASTDASVPSTVSGSIS